VLLQEYISKIVNRLLKNHWVGKAEIYMKAFRHSAKVGKATVNRLTG
jgi:hypothetical protein